jgi:nicotinate-nucleotide adenylyltransferase
MGEGTRIGLYGGTFDPVHVGHLDIARRLLKLFALDEVLFVPACVAPHKSQATVSRGLHRYAMLVLATQNDEDLRVSTVELDAPGKPYSVETVERLGDELGQSARLFFIMGADSWSEITAWRNWEKLLTLCDHIVVTRPGYEVHTSHVPSMRDRIADVRGQGTEQVRALTSAGAPRRIYLADGVRAHISASAIREQVRQGKNGALSGQVPPAVADYIRKYGLYTQETESQTGHSD